MIVLLHQDMEASCSGRCACNATCHQFGPLRSSVAPVIWRVPQALRTHSRCRQINSHKSVVANRAKRKHRQCVTAAQTSGEVAEVQELHGVRIIADAQRRPQVQYLVVWKDGTPDTWQVTLQAVATVPSLIGVICSANLAVQGACSEPS